MNDIKCPFCQQGILKLIPASPGRTHVITEVDLGIAQPTYLPEKGFWIELFGCSECNFLFFKKREKLLK